MERSAERNETNIFFMRTHATTNFFQSSHLDLKYLCESRVLNERKKKKKTLWSMCKCDISHNSLDIKENKRTSHNI